MTTMLERVARAIYHCTPRNKPWDSLAAPHKAYWLKRGRAAIEAMREADDAMLIAGGPYRTLTTLDRRPSLASLR